MSFLVTPDGVRLRISDRGEGPSTIPPVHGWTQSPALGRDNRGSRRTPPDARVRPARHGGVRQVARPLRFRRAPDDSAAVIGELGFRNVTLVGWSMGCSVSLGPRFRAELESFIARHPT